MNFEPQLLAEISSGRTKIEVFPQNGSKGCQTACLANVDRYFNDSDITPEDIDQELERHPEEALVSLKGIVWLLEKGLKVELSSLDPVGFEDYLEGTIDFDELMRRTADVEHDGSIEAARQRWDNPDTHTSWQALKQEHMGRKIKLFPYGSTFSEHTDASYELIETSLRQGKLALVDILLETNNYHRVLLMPGTREESFAIYIPALEEDGGPEISHDMALSSFKDWALGQGVELEEVAIVSK